jgi:chemotaxis protein CheZ
MTNWPNNRELYLQLHGLADFITKTRQELATLRPGEVKHEFILKATDELDAIVEGTASATHRIMDAADVIMDTASGIDKASADKVMNAVTSIYEACTFQDITGQRVTKVISMLRVIEERIDKMVAALGEGNSDLADTPTPDASPTLTPEKGAASGSVLHGPALPGTGPAQSEIDRIFSGESE